MTPSRAAGVPIEDVRRCFVIEVVVMVLVALPFAAGWWRLATFLITVVEWAAPAERADGWATPAEPADDWATPARWAVLLVAVAFLWSMTYGLPYLWRARRLRLTERDEEEVGYERLMKVVIVVVMAVSGTTVLGSSTALVVYMNTAS